MIACPAKWYHRIYYQLARQSRRQSVGSVNEDGKNLERKKLKYFEEIELSIKSNFDATHTVHFLLILTK